VSIESTKLRISLQATMVTHALLARYACSPRGGNSGTSMISKSQEETEVSLHLEDWGLEAKVVRLS